MTEEKPVGPHADPPDAPAPAPKVVEPPAEPPTQQLVPIVPKRRPQVIDAPVSSPKKAPPSSPLAPGTRDSSSGVYRHDRTNPGHIAKYKQMVADVDVVFKGELIEIRNDIVYQGKSAEIVILRDPQRPDDVPYYMFMGVLIRRAVDRARKLDWPRRRVFLHVSFREKVPVEHSHRGTHYWEGEANASLLKPYDTVVQTLDEMRALKLYDGQRVLVREMNLILRCDLQGIG